MKRMLVCLLTLLLVFAALPAGAEIRELEDPQLMMWCEIFSLLTLDSAADNPGGEYVSATGKIAYDPASMRSNGAGVSMADGGLLSGEGSYTLGMGASPDHTDMWYVSFTYSADTDTQVIIDNTVNMVFAASVMTDTFGETEDEIMENMNSIVYGLLGSNEDIAVEVGEFVFAAKHLGNQLLIMADSLDFYNAFYKGSIANYFYL